MAIISCVFYVELDYGIYFNAPAIPYDGHFMHSLEQKNQQIDVGIIMKLIVTCIRYRRDTINSVLISQNMRLVRMTSVLHSTMNRVIIRCGENAG